MADFRLLIISTCSSLKRFPIPVGCELEGYKQKPHEQVLSAWLETIQDTKWLKYSAENLYIGSHWKEIMECVKIGQGLGFSPELWVVSAGWGLVSSDFNMTPYSATFSPGENSIHNLDWPKEFSIKDRSRHWWNQINKNRELDFPQSLPNLFSSFEDISNVRFLIILSKDYYLPLELEIIELISAGAEVMIISCGIYSEIETVNPLIRDHVLPLNTKFKLADSYLKKNCHVLNARLATWIIRNYKNDLKNGKEAIYASLSEKLSQLNERGSLSGTEN
jgi:hypothetical protein